MPRHMIPPDERCQATTNRGQCTRPACEESNFCKGHKGENLNKRLQHYILSNPDLQKRLDRQSAAEDVRSLRQEIHLARTFAEKRADLIQNDGDFLAACGPVNTYLHTIEKLVSSCHKMEVALSGLLDKASIFSIGQEIILILVDELKEVENHEEIIDRISERIATKISEQK